MKNMLFYELTFLRKEFIMDEEQQSAQQKQGPNKQVKEAPGEENVIPSFSPEHRKELKELIDLL